MAGMIVISGYVITMPLSGLHVCHERHIARCHRAPELRRLPAAAAPPVPVLDTQAE